MRLPSNETLSIIAGVSLAAVLGAAVVYDTLNDEGRNYEGRDNEYQVVGTVHDVESDSTIHINENQLRIIQASGRAATWFENKDGQDYFSENFNFDPDYNQEDEDFFGACEENVTVGKVFDLSGSQIKATELQPGWTVLIKGSIRQQSKKQKTGKRSSTCGNEDKNVFNEVLVQSHNAVG
jgi:hypothetical protein